jgi:hypothetical protein
MVSSAGYLGGLTPTESWEGGKSANLVGEAPMLKSQSLPWRISTAINRSK